MKGDENLFKNLLELSERIFTPLGIWPTDTGFSYFMAYFNITMQTVQYLLVVLNNLVINDVNNESIENAFTMSNGGLIMVGYFISSLSKRHKYIELVQYMKADKEVFARRKQQEKWLVTVGREYKIIALGSNFLLATSILMRLILPIAQFAYIQLFHENKYYHLPASMCVPSFIFGDLATYIIETVLRFIMLGNLVCICLKFVLSTLYIQTKYRALKYELEFLDVDDDKVFNKLIKEHNEIIKMSKILNEVFSLYFLSNCAASFVNCSIMLFSIMTRNASLQNSLVEVPLVMIGMGQLFFLLYFGDRLLETSQSIAASAYNSQWYTKSLKNQRKIQFIMLRAQKPLTINVGGNNFLVASIYLFSQICSKAWATFNILRTTVKN